jgi:alanine racemase
VRVHLHVDTGMHRLGAEPRAVADLVAHARSLGGVELVALCSHFACAEADDPTPTAEQLAALQGAAGSADPMPALHAANSAAVIARPQTHLDAVRPGLMLYGLHPSPEHRALVDLQPAMALDAPVVRVAEVGPGEGIGYGHTYRTKVRARIATVRIGYADGYPRALSNRGRVLIHGRPASVVGRVCMDHVMVDASEIADVRVGDRALLWGTGLPAEEVAELAGTIAYELVSRVGTRVARIYEAAEEEDS